MTELVFLVWCNEIFKIGKIVFWLFKKIYLDSPCFGKALRLRFWCKNDERTCSIDLYFIISVANLFNNYNINYFFILLETSQFICIYQVVVDWFYRWLGRLWSWYLMIDESVVSLILTLNSKQRSPNPIKSTLLVASDP
jgi:hypothetical protein